MVRLVGGQAEKIAHYTRGLFISEEKSWIGENVVIGGFILTGNRNKMEMNGIVKRISAFVTC